MLLAFACAGWKFAAIDLFCAALNGDFLNHKKVNMNNKFLRLSSILACTGLSRSSIYAMMKNGCFPQNINISERAVAWLESDINKWVDEQIERSGKVA